MGGVMLQNEEWSGGLRYRVLPIPKKQRIQVDIALQATIEAVIEKVFTIHGIGGLC